MVLDVIYYLYVGLQYLLSIAIISRVGSFILYYSFQVRFSMNKWHYLVHISMYLDIRDMTPTPKHHTISYVSYVSHVHAYCSSTLQFLDPP